MTPEYRIGTIADFLKVPHEKQIECLNDFAQWLDLAREANSMSDLFTDALGGKVTFSTEYFTWADDGVQGITGLDFKDEGSERVVRVDLGREQS